jgi:hypothetical protein
MLTTSKIPSPSTSPMAAVINYKRLIGAVVAVIAW